VVGKSKGNKQVNKKQLKKKIQLKQPQGGLIISEYL
jgi:hypothetical protein